MYIFRDLGKDPFLISSNTSNNCTQTYTFSFLFEPEFLMAKFTIGHLNKCYRRHKYIKKKQGKNYKCSRTYQCESTGEITNLLGGQGQSVVASRAN